MLKPSFSGLILILALLWATPGEAATTHEDKCQSSLATSVTSVNCSITTVVAGNALAVGVMYLYSDTTDQLSTITLSTCTGTVNVLDRTIASAGNSRGASGLILNTGTGGNCTITANFSATVSEAKIWVHEIACSPSPCVLANNLSDADTFRNTTCTDCIPDVAGQLAITPTQDGAYFFGFMASNATNPAISPGTDFTDGATDDIRGTAEYYIQPTAASHATTFSRDDTTGSRAIAFAVVIEPSPAGGGVTPRGMLLGVYP